MRRAVIASAARSMTGQPENLLGAVSEAPEASERVSTPPSAARWLQHVSLNDWIVLGYLTLHDLALLTSPHHGAPRDRALFEVSALQLSFFTVVVVLIRGGLLTHPWLRPLAFRVSHYGGIQLTYFFMRGLLPVVNPGSLDLELHPLGTRLLGLEPALAMQAWISPASTEWF